MVADECRLIEGDDLLSGLLSFLASISDLKFKSESPSGQLSSSHPFLSTVKESIIKFCAGSTFEGNQEFKTSASYYFFKRQTPFTKSLEIVKSR